MVRLFTKPLLALGLAGVCLPALGHPFGRFGFVKQWKFVGLEVTQNSIGNEAPGSSRLEFSNSKSIWKPTFTTPYGQWVTLTGGEGAPDRIAASLLSGRAGLEFTQGFRLTSTSLASPYLTWEQGSVAPGVPTPKTHWLLLSWSDAEPPMLITFGSKDLHSLQIEGKPGHWTFISDKDFSGWVSFSCPLGDKPFPTQTAADMGQLAEAFLPAKEYWIGDQPQLRGERTAPYKGGIMADWEFTGSALVPAPAIEARSHGWYPQVTSKIFRTGFSTSDGPITFTQEPRLVVRFPMQERAIGKPVAVKSSESASGSADQSLAEASIPLLFADGSQAQFGKVHEQLEKLLAEAQLKAEPWTGDMLPYDQSGSGLLPASDAAAALSVFHGLDQPDNSMLVSVSWSQDWLTWRTWLPNADVKVRQKSGRISCLAAGLSPDPYLRVYGGMMYAGLACEDALSDPAESEPVSSLLDCIYNSGGLGRHPREASLFRPALVKLTGPSVWVQDGPAGSVLCWDAPKYKSIILLMAGAGQGMLPQGLPAGCAWADPLGRWMIRIDPSKEKSGTLILPESAASSQDS